MHIIHNVNGVYTAVLVYVDDIFIPSNNDDDVVQLKDDLGNAFKLGSWYFKVLPRS